MSSYIHPKRRFGASKEEFQPRSPASGDNGDKTDVTIFTRGKKRRKTQKSSNYLNPASRPQKPIKRLSSPYPAPPNTYQAQKRASITPKSTKKSPYSRTSRVVSLASIDESSVAIPSRTIQKINNKSNTLSYTKEDFKIYRNKCLKSGPGYHYFQAKNTKSGALQVIKVYNKQRVFELGLTPVVSTEILFHENLKTSENVLNIVCSFETKSELFIVFEGFECILTPSHTFDSALQTNLVSQIAAAMLEINSFDYSLVYLDMANIVQIRDLEGLGGGLGGLHTPGASPKFKIFDLNFLTKNGKRVKNTGISTVDALWLAPDIRNTFTPNKVTDAWLLGILMLAIFRRTYALRLNERMLDNNPVSYLTKMLDHKHKKGVIVDLLALILQKDNFKRAGLGRVIGCEFLQEAMGRRSLNIKPEKSVPVGSLTHLSEDEGIGGSVGVTFGLKSRRSRKSSRLSKRGSKMSRIGSKGGFVPMGDFVGTGSGRRVGTTSEKVIKPKRVALKAGKSFEEAGARKLSRRGSRANEVSSRSSRVGELGSGVGSGVGSKRGSVRRIYGRKSARMANSKGKVDLRIRKSASRLMDNNLIGMRGGGGVDDHKVRNRPKKAKKGVGLIGRFFRLLGCYEDEREVG